MDPGTGNRVFNAGQGFPAGRIHFNGRDSLICRMPAAAAYHDSIGTYTISSQACNTQCRHSFSKGSCLTFSLRRLRKAAGSWGKCTIPYNPGLEHAPVMYAGLQSCSTGTNGVVGRTPAGIVSTSEEGFKWKFKSVFVFFQTG